MSEPLSQPIPAEAFFEDVVPRTLAGLLGDRRLPPTGLALGVALTGAGGGEWVFRVDDGRLAVERTARDAAVLTLVASVDDWKGALWGGRGGPVGRGAAALLSGRLPGALRAVVSGTEEAPGPADPSWSWLEGLAPLAELRGLVRAVLADETEGDWAVAVQLGPGPIAPQPTVTITLASDDATALERGELDLLTAFMAGRLAVEGDMALLLQIQAIAMQALAPPPA